MILFVNLSLPNFLKIWQDGYEDISDRREKSNLAASTSILAGLVLSKEIIQGLLREDIMKESVIYQDIEEQGKQKGEANLVIRLLNRRFGQLSADLLTKIRGLSVEQLEDLGEALLDFKSENDLTQWFSNILKSSD